MLHDAFFKYQTKPKLTHHGDLYHEGKEFEVSGALYCHSKCSPFHDESVVKTDLQSKSGDMLFFVCLFVWIAPAEETPYSRSYFHASRLKEEVNSPGCGSSDSECR